MVHNPLIRPYFLALRGVGPLDFNDTLGGGLSLKYFWNVHPYFQWLLKWFPYKVGSVA